MKKTLITTIVVLLVLAALTPELFGNGWVVGNSLIILAWLLLMRLPIVKRELNSLGGGCEDAEVDVHHIV